MAHRHRIVSKSDFCYHRKLHSDCSVNTTSISDSFVNITSKHDKVCWKLVVTHDANPKRNIKLPMKHFWSSALLIQALRHIPRACRRHSEFTRNMRRRCSWLDFRHRLTRNLFTACTWSHQSKRLQLLRPPSRGNVSCLKQDISVTLRF